MMLIETQFNIGDWVHSPILGQSFVIGQIRIVTLDRLALIDYRSVTYDDHGGSRGGRWFAELARAPAAPDTASRQIQPPMCSARNRWPPLAPVHITGSKV